MAAFTSPPRDPGLDHVDAGPFRVPPASAVIRAARGLRLGRTSGPSVAQCQAGVAGAGTDAKSVGPTGSPGARLLTYLQRLACEVSESRHRPGLRFAPAPATHAWCPPTSV